MGMEGLTLLLLGRYGYVTHVVLNAGSSAFTGINWPHAIWMVLTAFHTAVTHPVYKRQRAADVGKDGYGWVWQANLGAHYILVSHAIGAASQGRSAYAPVPF